MPNHCEQDLFISGPESDLKHFRNFAQENDDSLSANKFIPYPSTFVEMDKAAAEARKNKNYSVVDGFNSGGYEWCIENWGSKWGIYNSNCKLERFKGSRSRLTFTFKSAWNPVIPVITAMSKAYPSLTFNLKYYERGCAYKGIFKIKDGSVLVNQESTYNGNRGG